MFAVINDNADADTDQEAGAAMRVMAEMLAKRGFDVRGPEHEASRRLTVTNAKRARCEIDVEDSERISWDYFPWSGGDTEPAEISEMVLRLLDADNSCSKGLHKNLHRGATLKGAVGREMKARGLDVDLNIYEDQQFFDVVAEVEVSNPARPERGVVRVTDEGEIQWQCEYENTAERTAAIADTTAALLVPYRAVAI